MRTVLRVVATLALTRFMVPIHAQDVSIPDPGLNAAIRDELQKPSGPLTTEDLLSLTHLNARSRNVSSIEGLEAARNLVTLNLEINRLTHFSLPGSLTKLSTLNVSINPLTNFFLPDGLTNLTALTLGSAGLTSLTLPEDLTRLNSLDLYGNQFSSFNSLSNLPSLIFLDLSFNSFTNFSLPNGLTNLTTFLIEGNPLTNVHLPGDLAALTELYLDQNLLDSFTLPAGLTNLNVLELSFNRLTNLSLPADLTSLGQLGLGFNRFTRFDLPPSLRRLGSLYLRSNQLTNFSVPAGLTGLLHLDVSLNALDSITLPSGLGSLMTLRLSENRFTTLTLPAGMTNLTGLHLGRNQLTNLVLPSDLNRLESINLSENRLATLDLPSGLVSLVGLFLVANQLTTLTLPPDMSQLIGFGFSDNPLATLVLPETLAATNLAGDVAALTDSGVAVYTYPLKVELVRIRQPIGAFQFALVGPPGVYSILASADLANWSQSHAVTNTVGASVFTDVEANLSPRKFYRALLQSTPPNMVFVPPNTFTMGSPTNEQDRTTFEGPQTTVTLSRGFWIGKYEVTQGEYLSIMNTNPSVGPEDLSRPVSRVTWPDATNYCAKLTQRELASGRIPAGSQYRLPTEAEWECAARAGTTTRFSYGDDPDYVSVGDHAWYASNSGLAAHPVGQKLPNPWGLYDMEGNVVEWCQDWFGLLPGGVQTDPTGPVSSTSGRKVTRGGAFDNTQHSCRSAARSLFNAGPSDADTNLGFRVVLSFP